MEKACNTIDFHYNKSIEEAVAKTFFLRSNDQGHQGKLRLHFEYALPIYSLYYQVEKSLECILKMTIYFILPSTYRYVSCILSIRGYLAQKQYVSALMNSI